MSFNLASLIAGPSSVPKIIKDVKPRETTIQKKSFTHGINVIFNHGTYKGYYGFVSEFFPAVISLMTSGRAYIETEKYGPLVNVGSRLMTDVGDSLIEQVIPSIGGEYVQIQLFKHQDDNQIRVGRIITNENIIMRSLLNQGKTMDEIQKMMNNLNNSFIMELTLFDVSLISNLSSLNIGDNSEADILAEQLTKMQINSEIPSPLEQLVQEVKTNVSLLDKIIHPEYFMDEIKVKVVFKKEMIGPKYYMNVSNNLGDIKIYNPNKAQYLVSYKKPITVRPNMVTLEKDNFAVVKSGPYAGQKLEVIEYSPAHLEVTLSSSGRTVVSHVVRKKDKKGVFIVDKFNNPIFETTLIYPSDVFYLDILLKNGNYAQVNKVLQNGNILITEKRERGYENREISQDEIKELQPSFKFSDKEIKIKEKEEEEMLIAGPSEEKEEEEQDYESETSEIDYEEIGEEIPEEIPEDQFKGSFKDIQRTTIEKRELTSQEKRFKDEIQNILKLFKLHDDSIDVYNTIDIINNLVKVITKKLNKINYTTDLLVTSNMKFIIVCLVLYELVKTGFDKNMDSVISILFPSYFTIKDIQAQSMNENIFLMKWEDNLSQDRIDEAISKIREYRKNESDYPKIIKELIINADIILQKMLGIYVNIIDRKTIDIGELIPLGVNPLTGRRYREEEAEKSRKRTKESIVRLRSQYVTVEDLLNNKPLPKTEVTILWSKINEPIIEKFKKEIQRKADTQGNLKQDYLYIKNNLYRAPFAIRDDQLKPQVLKAFEGMYNTLLETIRKQNIKAETIKKRKLEEQEQIRINRAKIMESKKTEELEEDEEIEPKHTKSYLKEQQRRETQRLITRGTRASNIAAYKMKKQREEKQIEEKQKEEKERKAEAEQSKKLEDEDMGKPWWMDTSDEL